MNNFMKFALLTFRAGVISWAVFNLYYIERNLALAYLAILAVSTAGMQIVLLVRVLMSEWGVCNMDQIKTLLKGKTVLFILLQLFVTIAFSVCWAWLLDDLRAEHSLYVLYSRNVLSWALIAYLVYAQSYAMAAVGHEDDIDIPYVADYFEGYEY